MYRWYELHRGTVTFCLYVPCANRDSLAWFFFFTLFCSGKYSGENPQAASATSSMVYLGGEQLATGASATATRASQLLVAAAAAAAVALL